MSTDTTETETRPIRRRARIPATDSRPRSFVTPDATWQAALEVCHQRGVSLGSQLTRALERIAAGETL